MLGGADMQTLSEKVRQMGKRKTNNIMLEYSYNGDNCFIVKFDPKEVEVINRTGEIRFITRESMVKFEVI